MNNITPQELKIKLDHQEDFQLIDIREDYEFDDFNIGGTNIPMDNVLKLIDKINTQNRVVFICNSGKRSAAIIHTLERKMKLNNLYSLTGGVAAYKELFAKCAL